MKKTSLINQDCGLTLIEVIASIVLISMILLSFMGMFLQSSKTITTSDDIINATYIAQKEMESIYKYRTAPTREALIDELNKQSTIPFVATNENTWLKQDNTIHIHLTLKKPDDLGLTPIIIKVLEDGKEKSKIENRYKLGG